MRTFLFLYVVAAAGFAFGQTGIEIRALEMRREGPLTHCRGDVEMATDTFVLRADEVDFHSDTAEAEARGHVRIKLLGKAPANAKLLRPAGTESANELENQLRRLKDRDRLRYKFLLVVGRQN